MEVRGIFKPLESLPAYNTMVQRVQKREAVLVSGAGDPVSYTHLDVYKRQERAIAAIPMVFWNDPHRLLRWRCGRNLFSD